MKNTNNSEIKRYYNNGKRHREDGPAVEYSDGTKIWYINDKLHRDDGPAVVYGNEMSFSKEWWLDNVRYSEEEYKVELRQRNINKVLGLLK